MSKDTNMSTEELGRGIAHVWGAAFLGPSGAGLVEAWGVIYGSTGLGPTLILHERVGHPIDLQLLQVKLPLEAGISMELQLQTDGGARWPTIRVAPGTQVAVIRVVEGKMEPVHLGMGEVTVAGMDWPLAGAGVHLPVERAIIRPLR